VRIKQAPSTRHSCGHSQELSPGLRELRATGDSTVLVPSTASQPTRRATLVVVGDPPPSRSRRERKLRARLAKFAHLTEASSQLEPTETCSQPEPVGSSSQHVTEPTGPPSQPTPSTSQGTPDPSSVEPEAMDTGALASSSAAESEKVSKGSSEVEDSPSAGALRTGQRWNRR